MPDSAFIKAIIESAGAGTAIMVILFLTGWIWTKFAVKALIKSYDEKDAVRKEQLSDANARVQRAEAERDKVQGQLDQLLQRNQDQLIPLLTNFVNATQTMIPLIQQLVQRRQSTR